MLIKIGVWLLILVLIVPEAFINFVLVRIWSSIASLYSGLVGSVMRLSKENLFVRRLIYVFPTEHFLAKSILKSPPMTIVALSMLSKLDRSWDRDVYMFSRSPVGGLCRLIRYSGLVHFLIILIVINSRSSVVP